MKKLFMILGTLAVLAVFAGCANSSNSSGNANRSFTVKEIECTANENQQAWAIEHNCPKNAEGKYIFFIYTLEDTSVEAFKKSINKDIFYLNEGGAAGNMFHSRCKSKIEKMLSDGEIVSDADKPDWMKGEQFEGSILLPSYPQ